MPNSRVLKIAVALLWVTGLVTAYWVWKQSQVPLSELPAAFAEWLHRFGAFKAAAIFLVLYSLRPLIFFPSILFALASGMVFGPWLGITLTMLGENFGANLAFCLTRLFGRRWVKEHERGFVQKLDESLGSNGLFSVAVFRLINLPYDSVSYCCGVTSVRARDFAIGTFLGSIPYLASIAMLGGAASEHVGQTINIFGTAVPMRAVLVWTALTLFLAGIIAAWKLRRLRTASTHQG